MAVGHRDRDRNRHRNRREQAEIDTDDDRDSDFEGIGFPYCELLVDRLITPVVAFRTLLVKDQMEIFRIVSVVGERVYTLWGRSDLSSAWTTPTNAASRFFRVGVSLP